MRGLRTVVVNDGYRIAPWADALVALDEDWWTYHGRKVVETFKGETYCIEPCVRDRFGAVYLRPIIRDGFSTNWESPSYGADSGQFAIQIAVLKGAKRILLLGYDCGSAPDGKRHWFGDHPKPLRNESPYGLFREKYAKAAAWCAANGITVINCSRVTSLTCFPRASLEEALCTSRSTHGLTPSMSTASSSRARPCVGSPRTRSKGRYSDSSNATMASSPSKRSRRRK